MSIETAQTSATWQTDQRIRATTYKPRTQHAEMPGSYRCVGECTEIPPPAPGSMLEGFAAPPSAMESPWFWLSVAAAATLYLTVTLTGSKRTWR